MNGKKPGFGQLTQSVKNLSGIPLSFIDRMLAADSAGTQARGMDARQRLDEKRFDLAKMLSMQDYRQKERKQNWNRDFAFALSRGGHGR